MTDDEQAILDWAIIAGGAYDVTLGIADAGVAQLLAVGFLRKSDDQPSAVFTRYEITESGRRFRQVDAPHGDLYAD